MLTYYAKSNNMSNSIVIFLIVTQLCYIKLILHTIRMYVHAHTHTQTHIIIQTFGAGTKELPGMVKCHLISHQVWAMIDSLLR